MHWDLKPGRKCAAGGDELDGGQGLSREEGGTRAGRVLGLRRDGPSAELRHLAIILKL